MMGDTLTVVLPLSHERGHTGQSRVTESTCTAGHHTVPGEEIRKSQASCTVPVHVLSVNKDSPRFSANLWQRKIPVQRQRVVDQSEQIKMLTGRDSFDQAKVFRAHAVPQGLCANLINALKLLANQQEDGDGLLQNIVKDLGKKSRRGLMDGLREFIEVDNERAMDVGALHQTGTF